VYFTLLENCACQCKKRKQEQLLFRRRRVEIAEDKFAQEEFYVKTSIAHGMQLITQQRWLIGEINGNILV
jgi:hypothetical protein